MKVNFRGKVLNIKNELKSRAEFCCNWNMYTIEIERWRSEKLWNYYISSKQFDWTFIDKVSTKDYTMSQVLQLCFDLIDQNIDNIEKESEKLLNNLQLLTSYRKLKCPYCGSRKIFKFRLDNDWASGSGDYSTVNDDKYYTEEELQYDSFDRPDIEIYHCGCCGHFFD